MKRLVLLCTLFFCMLLVPISMTLAAGKNSKAIKGLVKEINWGLDSIADNNIYTVVNGHRYYRFNEGVFTIPDYGIFMGVFNASPKNRIHFIARNGEDSFVYTDKGKRYSKKILKKLLLKIRERV
ncbi:MAG: hypothetical protein UR85_C0010G0016 [Candidatus Nomurabacteria bacterium GW2011_GWF2_35_66]|uniref:Bacterial Pleckstrin homology domain-containing protein n=1 Tax=Candidatus Nomurabacteria bacterium GW2011_GWE1_35_16 TaxID=1618761 RepID=A0A0G0EEX0_9BACT|nr:MAG: hypothetical protein UR55_C0016G0012 [Candidatus Nomurabacteria bacterium GW2011_GWF1_34_20]KKP61618.1 MAG: hypothetical protein UR57_C0015G0014 [Candidatus Nomurabacteria bacterium GW2011_GWE2_34_25]KKP65912.1 MAG: hypothetical protein UR64_C0016G0012 [Candidatus Nomurabacteria bacterium GW2011_GWE1_35_16]KKP82968.1 MAG: hypothetical protein UR85_C0010G0016 [Candidatus Nomurabacteria bacterium GW2011_GWF2_35_66]HAE36281.1 hypothetical protein [Candidatus Nomurabacteria bacterium]